MTPTLKQLEFDLLRLVGSLNLRPVLDDAIKAGELLAKAKEQVPYREWSSWLSRLRLTQRSAHDYMACYRHQSQRAPAAMTIQGFLEHVRRANREARQAEREALRADIAAKAGDTPPGIELHHADATKYPWPTGIDLICTDPPWASMDCYEWLGTMAMSHLRPGGLLLAQVGNAHLPGALDALRAAGLTYVWTMGNCF